MSNDRLKFKAYNKSMNKWFSCPSDSFSLVFHDVGARIQLWASDGLIDEFEADEVAQWTGLYDSEGVEIYEMDYLSDCHFTWVVEKCLDGWWCKLISHNNDKINKTPVSYILDARLAAGMPVTVCGNAYDA